MQSPVSQKPTEVKALALSKQGLLYAGDDHGNLVEWAPNFKLNARFSMNLNEKILFKIKKFTFSAFKLKIAWKNCFKSTWVECLKINLLFQGHMKILL